MSTASVYCGCGAQWHGQNAVGNSVIDRHEARYGTEGSSCEIVSHETFLSVFPKRCKCSACTSARGNKRKASARMRNAAPELYAALKELAALVRGECPSLLNEDSGGDARLSLAVDAAIAKAEAGR